MRTIRRTLSGLGLIIATTVGAACGPLDAPAPEDEIAEVGETTQALGEAGCAVAGGSPYSGGVNNGAARQMPIIGSGAWGEVAAISPTTSYGNGAGCPAQFIVEIQNTQNVGFDASAVPSPGGRDATTCPRLRAEVGVYLHRARLGWSLYGTSRVHGVWAGIHGCVFQPDAGQHNLQVGGRIHDAVRVVGRGLYCSGVIPGVCTFATVSVGISSLIH